MSHLNKALVGDQFLDVLDADLDGDLNEILVSHDGSIRPNDPLDSHREPRSVDEEDCLLEEGSGSSVTKSTDVKLFAEEVEINVEVKVVADGIALMESLVRGSVDEAKHGADALGVVFVAEVDHIGGCDLYIASVSCVDHVGSWDLMQNEDISKRVTRRRP